MAVGACPFDSSNRAVAANFPLVLSIFAGYFASLDAHEYDTSSRSLRRGAGRTRRRQPLGWPRGGVLSCAPLFDGCSVTVGRRAPSRPGKTRAAAEILERLKHENGASGMKPVFYRRIVTVEALACRELG